MTDHNIEDLYEKGLSRTESAEEAWDKIKDQRQEVSWDMDAVRVDETNGQVRRFRHAASDD